MRFLAAATIGLLASQASLVSSLNTYTLEHTLTCDQYTDVIHFDYSFSGLATPPSYPGTDIYEVAYRVVQSGNSAQPVAFRATMIQAREGTGSSDINYNPLQNITAQPKDNAGPAFVGQSVYSLPGTTIFHLQVNGVSAVQGFFEVDNFAAAAANLVCDTTNKQPNIYLLPQQYTINGIKQIVTNSFDVVNNANYQALVQRLTQEGSFATKPVYHFDVSPAVNIDGCYKDIDPATNKPRIRVPFRVTNLADLGFNEQGVVSLAIADGQGNPNSEWTVSITEKIGFVGKGFRDAFEPTILDWVQPTGFGYVFGRLDFPAGANITCPDVSDPVNNITAGKTDLLLSVVDYSTINVATQVQVWHFLANAPDNGINDAAQVKTAIGQLNVQAADAPKPAVPDPAKAAARKAAAAKACAAAKAAAAKKAEQAASAAANAAAASSAAASQNAAQLAAAAQAAAAAAGQAQETPCLLTVPPNPLTAQGLATPYVLGGLCTMADTAGFVQATIISPATGKLMAYQPLVIQAGKTAAIKPVVPTLPQDAVVGLWFGSNAAFQKLVAANPATLTNAKCVNGANINGKLSLFGQIASCNGAAFYAAAALAIFNGLLVVPPLGNAADGKPCPTLRSFVIVDQDVQDNLQTQYLLDANGNTAINSVANLNTLTKAAQAAKQAPPIVLTNPGDNPLLSRFINPAIKCNNWMIPDLSVPGTMSVTAPVGEIFAAFRQAAPVARAPAGNPMTLDNNGNLNLAKTNAFRVNLVGEPAVQNLNQANTATYCQNMVGPNGAVRLMGPVLQPLLANANGPVAGQKLLAFLQDRFAAAVGADNLNCGKLVPGITNPLAGGAVIAAQSLFSVADALLVGSSQPDNQAADPYGQLTDGAMQGPNTTTGTTFPVAIVAGAVGGVVVLIIASLIIFKVVQKRKAGNVMATTARECKV